MSAFEDWNPILSIILVVGGLVLLSLFATEIVRRKVNANLLHEHTEVGGFILAVVGVVYAVLLGFVVIGVWDRFNQAEIRTFDEAASVTSLYRDADAFPNASLLRSELRTYVNDVIQYGWPAMRRGAESVRSERSIDRVDALIRHLPVKSPSQQDVQAQMLSSIDAVMLARDQRIFMSATGIDPLMWSTLILSAFITIGFTLLFGFRHVGMQRLMIGGLALVIGLVLYLAMSLDYPYRGATSISPRAFTAALQAFNQIDSVK